MSPPAPSRRSGRVRTGVFGLPPELPCGPQAGELIAQLQTLCQPARSGIVLLPRGIQTPSAALSHPDDGRWDASADQSLVEWLSQVYSTKYLDVPECLRKSLSFRALAVPIASPFERFGVLVASQSPAPQAIASALEAAAGDFALQLETQYRKLAIRTLRKGPRASESAQPKPLAKAPRSAQAEGSAHAAPNTYGRVSGEWFRVG